MKFGTILKPIKKLRRRISVQANDIFYIPQSNGSNTLICLLAFWPKLESVMTILILSKEFSAEDIQSTALTSVVSEEIAQRNLMAILSTTTNTVKVGEWPKIGSIERLDLTSLLPAKPFKDDSLEGARYEGALLVEALVEAYRGLVGWDELLPGRPGYLQSLLYSS